MLSRRGLGPARFPGGRENAAEAGDARLGDEEFKASKFVLGLGWAPSVGVCGSLCPSLN